MDIFGGSGDDEDNEDSNSEEPENENPLPELRFDQGNFEIEFPVKEDEIQNRPAVADNFQLSAYTGQQSNLEHLLRHLEEFVEDPDKGLVKKIEEDRKRLSREAEAIKSALDLENEEANELEDFGKRVDRIYSYLEHLELPDDLSELNTNDSNWGHVGLVLGSEQRGVNLDYTDYGMKGLTNEEYNRYKDTYLARGENPPITSNNYGLAHLYEDLKFMYNRYIRPFHVEEAEEIQDGYREELNRIPDLMNRVVKHFQALVKARLELEEVKGIDRVEEEVESHLESVGENPPAEKLKERLDGVESEEKELESITQDLMQQEHWILSEINEIDQHLSKFLEMEEYRLDEEEQMVRKLGAPQGPSAVDDDGIPALLKALEETASDSNPGTPRDKGQWYKEVENFYREMMDSLNRIRESDSEARREIKMLKKSHIYLQSATERFDRIEQAERNIDEHIAEEYSYKEKIEEREDEAVDKILGCLKSVEETGFTPSDIRNFDQKMKDKYGYEPSDINSKDFYEDIFNTARIERARAIYTVISRMSKSESLGDIVDPKDKIGKSAGLEPKTGKQFLEQAEEDILKATRTRGESVEETKDVVSDMYDETRNYGEAWPKLDHAIQEIVEIPESMREPVVRKVKNRGDYLSDELAEELIERPEHIKREVRPTDGSGEAVLRLTGYTLECVAKAKEEAEGPVEFGEKLQQKMHRVQNEKKERVFGFHAIDEAEDDSCDHWRELKKVLDTLE